MERGSIFIGLSQIALSKHRLSIDKEYQFYNRIYTQIKVLVKRIIVMYDINGSVKFLLSPCKARGATSWHTWWLMENALQKFAKVLGMVPRLPINNPITDTVSRSYFVLKYSTVRS